MTNYVWAIFFCIGYLHSSAHEIHQREIALSTVDDVYLSEEDIYYYDGSDKLVSPDQIISHGNFVPLKNRVLKFNPKQSVTWIRISIDNDLKEKYWNIFIDDPLIDQVEAYLLEHSNAKMIFKASTVTKKYAGYIFTAPEGKTTVFIRIVGSQNAHIPLKIISTARFISKRHWTDLLHALYLGIILSFVLYNLFMYFSLKDRTHLFYSLYQLCAGLSFVCLSGYFLQIGGPVIFNNSLLFASLSIIFASFFLAKFLRLSPGGGIIIKIAALFSLGTALLSLWSIFLPQSEVYWYVRICYLISGIFFLGAGSWLYKKTRHGYILFFISAWGVFIVSVSILFLKDFGYLPYHALTQNSLQLGGVIEAVLLSTALAGRIAFYQTEKNKAEEREIGFVNDYNRMVEKQNLLLETTVKERTEKLEEVNQMKDKFFSIIAQDLQHPLNSLSKFTTWIGSHISELSEEEIVSMSKNLNVSVRNTISLTDNLLAWARSQMKIDEFILENISVCESLGWVLSQLGPSAENKRIRIVNLVPEGLEVMADKGQFILVLSNLISNAIKYTPSGGSIVITGALVAGKTEIKIADTGIGFSEYQVETVFNINQRKTTLGTDGETGSGLGLMLSHEFISRNGGKIELESKEGQGSTFTITLPSPFHKKLSFTSYNEKAVL